MAVKRRNNCCKIFLKCGVQLVSFWSVEGQILSLLRNSETVWRVIMFIIKLDLVFHYAFIATRGEAIAIWLSEIKVYSYFHISKEILTRAQVVILQFGMIHDYQLLTMYSLAACCMKFVTNCITTQLLITLKHSKILSYFYNYQHRFFN